MTIEKDSTPTGQELILPSPFKGTWDFDPEYDTVAQAIMESAESRFLYAVDVGVQRELEKKLEALLGTHLARPVYEAARWIAGVLEDLAVAGTRAVVRLAVKILPHLSHYPDTHVEGLLPEALANGGTTRDDLKTRTSCH